MVLAWHMSSDYDDFEDEFDESFAELDEDDVDSDVLPCPACGREVYEDTDQCPYCGEWIMPLAGAAGRKKWIWVAAAVLALIAIIALSVL